MEFSWGLAWRARPASGGSALGVDLGPCEESGYWWAVLSLLAGALLINIALVGGFFARACWLR